MKTTHLMVSFCLALSALNACQQPKAPKEDAPVETQLTSFEEKVSYLAGQDVGRSLKARGTAINLDMVKKGMEDSFLGRETLIKPEEAVTIRREYAQKLREQRSQAQKELAGKNQAEGQAFLAENAKKEGVITTASGLQYQVLQEGNGPKAKATDTVKVNYVGTLINGTEFDSTTKRGHPATLRLGVVVPGWSEGLQLMSAGSKYRLFIPSALGYGERGSGTISPNSVLIFDVELLEILPEQGNPGTGTGKPGSKKQ